jgi:hypothetical protein
VTDKRYVIFSRSHPISSSEVDSIEQQPGVHVVDRTLDRALLVEANGEAIRHLRNRHPDWMIEEEKVLPHPSPPAPR